MKNHNSTIEEKLHSTELGSKKQGEGSERFTLTRTDDKRLQQQMTDDHNAAYERGLCFCQNPMQGGYQGMERAANINLPEHASCKELAQLVFEILCGEDSDGPIYQTAGEFWKDQFKRVSHFWIPTRMQIVGFYHGVQDYWNAQEVALKG